ncbi:uncharacterized protein LOC106158990 isoform X2 [Lingula anatina]|uniref:Uncharacterized protein LOC106158990 isoform X2 n=1 Tax=Lingula anatina TaxID=7574 RepID=A0A1S3HX33_LINAN|nr:uncharacterized protein LOC106158990 isoform X2 [Lingula anatina]|eukprot:XP_013390590.1 uncharacterized protein LOC106158990 isoform X2 [Lingula anatina]
MRTLSFVTPTLSGSCVFRKEAPSPDVTTTWYGDRHISGQMAEVTKRKKLSLKQAKVKKNFSAVLTTGSDDQQEIKRQKLNTVVKTVPSDSDSVSEEVSLCPDLVSVRNFLRTHRWPQSSPGQQALPAWAQVQNEEDKSLNESQIKKDTFSHKVRKEDILNNWKPLPKACMSCLSRQKFSRSEFTAAHSGPGETCLQLGGKNLRLEQKETLKKKERDNGHKLQYPNVRGTILLHPIAEKIERKETTSQVVDAVSGLKETNSEPSKFTSSLRKSSSSLSGANCALVATISPPRGTSSSQKLKSSGRENQSYDQNEEGQDTKKVRPLDACPLCQMKFETRKTEGRL